ncbi:ribosomal RNA small subunit methyltransferase B-like, partial [Trifolium medium]|nr:ribosomal RNA small subunit methyltransferase B-like [Trifolium medium]
NVQLTKAALRPGAGNMVNGILQKLVVKDFHIDPVDRYAPHDFVTPNGFFFSNSVKHSLDGSFAARLVRAL